MPAHTTTIDKREHHHVHGSRADQQHRDDCSLLQPRVHTQAFIEPPAKPGDGSQQRTVQPKRVGLQHVHCEARHPGCHQPDPVWLMQAMMSGIGISFDLAVVLAKPTVIAVLLAGSIVIGIVTEFVADKMDS